MTLLSYLLCDGVEVFKVGAFVTCLEKVRHQYGLHERTLWDVVNEEGSGEVKGALRMVRPHQGIG